jgi:hypothetical protein
MKRVSNEVIFKQLRELHNSLLRVELTPQCAEDSGKIVATLTDAERAQLMAEMRKACKTDDGKEMIIQNTELTRRVFTGHIIS